MWLSCRPKPIEGAEFFWKGRTVFVKNVKKSIGKALRQIRRHANQLQLNRRQRRFRGDIKPSKRNNKIGDDFGNSHTLEFGLRSNNLTA